MEQPYFSVIICTKNRSQLVGYALQSVLQQSFTNFEIVVADNDDTVETAHVVAQFDDPRIRYYNTGGHLSMPDNWEFGLSQAQGQYVTILTDRSVLKSYALTTIKKAIETHGEDIYVWGHEGFDGKRFLQHTNPLCAQTQHRIVPSRNLFDLFMRQTYEGYTHYLPKGFNSCFSNGLLQEIRNSSIGRVCPPVSPDHTLAFLAMAHRPNVVLMNEPLFVWGAAYLSNGASLIRGTATARRFLQDLNMTEDDLCAEVPIKTQGIHNSNCNDLLKLKHTLPENFRGVELDSFHYFLSCRQEFETYYKHTDPQYVDKMTAWHEALDRQPFSIVNRINRCVERDYADIREGTRALWTMRKTKRIASKAITALRCWDAVDKGLETWQSICMKNLPGQPTHFVDILEAVAWLERYEQKQMSRTAAA